MFDDVTTFCQEILKIKSFSGQESQCIKFIEEIMKKLKYDKVWIDEYGSVIGQIKGSGKRKVMLDGHIDTVGIFSPSEWVYNPYGGEVKENKMYGRGASDMKGGIAAMIYGAASLIDKKKKLKGDIFVCVSVMEEISGELSAKKIVDTICPDFIINGEPTNLNLCIGQKGRVEFKVSVYGGKGGHSCNSKSDLNVIKLAIPIIQEIDHIPKRSDLFLGEGHTELTGIISSPPPPTDLVPLTCDIFYEKRLVQKEETEKKVVEEIKFAIEKARKLFPGIKAKVIVSTSEATTYTGVKLFCKKYGPSWQFSKDENLVIHSLKALKGIGLNPAITFCSGFTAASYGAGRGIPTIIFGPGEIKYAHKSNEAIRIDNLIKATKGYAAIIKEILM
jgi:putative selenium metabolism hydrolase